MTELSPLQFPFTYEVLRSAVTSGITPGAVAGFWSAREPRRIQVAAVGNRRKVPSELPMLLDTVFDLASVSKVFATTALAGVMVDRGWLRWDTPIQGVLPDYPFSGIELRHLLSHTAGFGAWEPFWEKLRDEFSSEGIENISIEKRQKAMRRLVFRARPEAAPGQRALYSDISFLLLGFILEELLTLPLDQAVRKHVWDPMGVAGAYYHRIHRRADADIDEKVAATEDSSWRGGVLQGQVFDDNCWAMGGYAGQAGAFGTAQDVLHFARVLYSTRFFSKSTLDAMWTRVNQPQGCERTLGWDTPSGESPSVGKLFSKNTVGHLGYTGTSLWIDLDAGLAVTLLTNRVHPSREHNQMPTFRPLFHDALRKDLKALY